MDSVWKPVVAFLVVLVGVSLLLGLSSLDAVQGGTAALVVAAIAAAIVAAIRKSP
jgi:hypothetical protein